MSVITSASGGADGFNLLDGLLSLSKITQKKLSTDFHENWWVL